MKTDQEEFLNHVEDVTTLRHDLKEQFLANQALIDNFQGELQQFEEEMASKLA